jgi:competence protein ComEA
MRLLVLSCIVGLFSVCNQPAQVQTAQPTTANRNANQPCVNLNTANAEALKSLPEIGEVLASRIIEYRERHGGFRRPQDVIIVEGLTEKKYRAIAAHVCVE